MENELEDYVNDEYNNDAEEDSFVLENCPDDFYSESDPGTDLGEGFFAGLAVITFIGLAYITYGVDRSIPYKARKPVVQNAIVQTHDAESIDKFINRNSL